MISDAKEFEKLLKICRKQGVTEVKFGGAYVKFGDMPKKTTEVDETDEVPSDELTPEQLIFFSAGGTPP